MECMNEVVPLILSILVIALVIVLIMLGLRLMKTLDHVDKLLYDIDDKVEKLDGMFEIVDNTSNMIASVRSKVSHFVVDKLGSLFKKKRKDD